MPAVQGSLSAICDNPHAQSSAVKCTWTGLSTDDGGSRGSGKAEFFLNVFCGNVGVKMS